MIRLVGNHNRRELLITFAIWGVLLCGAITGLFVLRAKAVDIINHIYYVNVTRGAKATVLYAEAEKNARAVMADFQRRNANSGELVPVPKDDEHLQRALALYEEAFEIDPQPIFSEQRTVHYEMLAQLHESAGDSAGQRLAHAHALLTVGDEAAALSYLEQAREEEPESAEPLVLLARVHLRNDNVGAAAEILEQAFALAEVSAEARYVKADVAARQNDIETAINEMRLAVTESPENLDYRARLADFLARTQKFDEGQKIMQDGLAYGGWLDPAYLHRYASFLDNTNDLEEAIRVLEQADKLAPYSGDVQFQLARLYNKAGRKRQAASALRRATEVKPELQDRMFEE